jgi:superfamily II DNA or RNA helicase
LSSITAKDLQDKGVLSNLHINIIQVNDYLTVFDSYQSELKYLVTDKARVAFIAGMIKDITDTGNTLILVDRVATGELLEKLIPNAIFLDGSVKSVDRKAEYSKYKTEDDNHIIATYGICSTGIDVPRVFNLVLFEAGKSFIKVIQSIGRGLRVAKDKDFVNVYDITSTAKYAKRHLTARKKYYTKCSYPSSMVKVDMPTK